MPHKPPRPLPDSDWSKRTHAIPFSQLMSLTSDTASPNTYISTSPAYPPTTTTRTYGGHVIAQAAYAACHTLPHGLHVHSITGYFLSIGDTRYPFRYVVRRVRDGGVYSVRMVEAFQDLPGSKGKRKSKEDVDVDIPMFMGIIGFKRDESHYHTPGHAKRRRDFAYQGLPRDWLRNEYGGVLGDQSFEKLGVCQGMDGLWPDGTMSVEGWKIRGDVFPGLEMRKIDMSTRNTPVCQGALEDEGQGARGWRCLLVYRLISEAGHEQGTPRTRKTAADDELNLYACAHIYASDRNSLFTTQRALGFERMIGQVGSLSHTVNFHGGAESLRMIAKNAQRKEFVQESWGSSSGDDRVCHESRIFDRETGRIIASTVQDGMMRMPVVQNTNVVDGDVILRRKAKL